MNILIKTSTFVMQKVLLADCEDQIKKLLHETFENYKSLDEFSQTGLTDLFGPIVDSAAPALGPAVRLFSLLHDVLSPTGQDLLRNYLQASPQSVQKSHLLLHFIFLFFFCSFFPFRFTIETRFCKYGNTTPKAAITQVILLSSTIL
jgi:hypothetical protein